jgi:predicted nuclease with TOPRIM domain
MAEYTELVDAMQKAFSNSMNLGAINDRITEHQNRLNSHSDKMRELEINNARREENEKTIISKLDTIGSAVEEIKNKPSKRYELVWGIIVTAVITALVAYLLKI